MTVATQVPHLGALMRAGEALACAGPLPARVEAALEAVVPSFGAVAARVRAGGHVRVVHGEPSGKRPALVVPVRFGDRVIGEITAWRQGAFGVLDEQAWHVFADVVAVAVEGEDARCDAAVVAAETERDAVAAEMHDGLLQSLVATRLATELAGGDTAAIRELTREGRDLTWHLRCRTPRGDVVPALRALADRVGRAALRLDAGPTPDALPRVTATLAYRLVQAAHATCANAGARVVDVRLRPAAGAGLRVTVGHDSTDPPYAGGALQRWLDRLAAVGGSVTWGSGTGWLVLDIPGRPGEEARS